MSYNNNGYGQQGDYQQGGNHMQSNYNSQSSYQGGQQQPGYNRNNSGEAGDYYGQGQQQYGGGPGQFQNQQQYGGGSGQNQNQSPPPYGQQSQSQGYGNSGYGDQGYGGPDGETGDRGFMGAMAGGAAGAFGGHKIGGTGSTIVGALAGAFVGHKTQDGISDWKDKRDEKKEEEERRKKEEERREEEEKRRREDGHHHSGHHGHGSHNSPRGGNYAGGFTQTSRDIYLDTHGDYRLHAQCRRQDGSYQSSTISLNRVLENDRGSFRWSGGGGGSSSSIVTVQSGDTLRSIAARNNCTFEELARNNGIQNPDMIYPGQSLQIPGRGSGSCGSDFGSSARNVRLVDGGQRLEAELSCDGRWSTASVNLDERIRNRDGCLELA
ncbi:carbohydrate-binding module family 50 protein [Aaosphaeria arxii CBS 175.79]|uniref:Carbohydrate-binding module family 50 protein n=1 Tax=Aaosphaeria arxii CBS 175.79 TaxID=1450172 RepID=A0A6A5X7Z2_9PLEO|nr:carbohydrate-binding module family 50 protein [Aaosphaeria arxii CBS 175.79]KAF2009068.1 carbohydrate-binding module family 50 protein [Aaosphaeria arxii CBS 175.79]